MGIQIQGDQYRLFVESSDFDVLGLAESLKKEGLWLNPENEVKHNILKFGKGFKYSYSSIKDKTVEELVPLIMSDISRLFGNMDKLRDRLQLEQRPIEIEARPATL